MPRKARSVVLFAAVVVAAALTSHMPTRGAGPPDAEAREAAEVRERERAELRERERNAERREVPREELRAKALEFLKRFRPDVVARLDEIKRDDRERYEDLIREAFEDSMELDELERIEPEEHAERLHVLQVRAHAFALVVRLQKAPAGKDGPIRSELVELLGDIFDQRQRELEGELLEIEMHLNEVRREVQRQRAEKREAVEEYVRELIGEAAAVQW